MRLKRFNPLKDAVYKHVRKEMRFKAERQQLGVRRVVVVFLQFNARVLQSSDNRRDPQLSSLSDNKFCKLSNAKRLGELIEYSVFTRLRRIQNRQLDATERVSNVQETAFLTSCS